MGDIPQLQESGVGALAGEVQRTWVLSNDLVRNKRRKDRPTIILLRHNTLTGERFVSINGNVADEGYTTAYNHNWQGTFEIDSGGGGGADGDDDSTEFRSSAVTVRIRHPTMAKIYYSCAFGGNAIPELNTAIDIEAQRRHAATDAALTVSIPSAVKSGEEVVWYAVRTIRKEPFEVENCVHRRFRDFYWLYDQLRAAFKGNHLYDCIPEPPARSIKFLEDHLDRDFIEIRRQALENFLRVLLSKHHKFSTNTDVLDFVGMSSDGVKECSIIFRAGALGVTLNRRRLLDVSRRGGAIGGDEDSVANIAASEGAAGRASMSEESAGGGKRRAQAPADGPEQAVVRDFKKLANGKDGPVKRSGLVGIGDIVSKIDGESVLSLTYDHVIHLIKTTRRPVPIHFLGYIVRGEGEEGEDLDAANADGKAAAVVGESDEFVGGGTLMVSAGAAAAAAATSSSSSVKKVSMAEQIAQIPIVDIGEDDDDDDDDEDEDDEDEEEENDGGDDTGKGEGEGGDEGGSKSAEKGEEGASSSEAAGLGSNVTASDSGSSEAPAAVEKRKPVVEKTDFFGDDDGDEEEGLFS